MILAIILSSLKTASAIAEVLLYCENTGRSYDTFINRCLVLTGNINLTFVITLFIFCYYSKKGLQTYANFLNDFIYNLCSDSMGLDTFRSFLSANGFQKVFAANFWLLWSTLAFDLTCAVSRLTLIGGISLRK